MSDLEEVLVDDAVRHGWRTDNPRIGRIIEKIIKGLFFHEKGIRLPEHQRLSWNIIDSEFNNALGHGATIALKHSPVHNFGDGVFKYSVRIAATHNSFWKFTFYDDIELFAVTIKLDDATK